MSRAIKIPNTAIVNETTMSQAVQKVRRFMRHRSLRVEPRQSQNGARASARRLPVPAGELRRPDFECLQEISVVCSTLIIRA